MSKVSTYYPVVQLLFHDLLGCSLTSMCWICSVCVFVRTHTHLYVYPWFSTSLPPSAPKVKEYLADPSKFVVAAAPEATTDGGGGGEKEEAPAKEESEEESDDDMGMGEHMGGASGWGKWVGVEWTERLKVQENGMDTVRVD